MKCLAGHFVLEWYLKLQYIVQLGHAHHQATVHYPVIMLKQFKWNINLSDVPTRSHTYKTEKECLMVTIT